NKTKRAGLPVQPAAHSLAVFLSLRWAATAARCRAGQEGRASRSQFSWRPDENSPIALDRALVNQGTAAGSSALLALGSGGFSLVLVVGLLYASAIANAPARTIAVSIAQIGVS